MPRQLVDLTNQRFGRLLVLRYEKQQGKRGRWICQCDCGKQTASMADNLKAGLSTSCGCIRDERIAKVAQQREVMNLEGTTCGFLTYLREEGYQNHYRQIRCLCACGSEKVVFAKKYIDGSIQSCGCLQRSLSSARAKTRSGDKHWRRK